MATQAISIDNGKFTPADVVVHVGDTVTWTNNNAANGNLISGGLLSGPGDAGLLANGGTGTFSFTFGVTGMYSMSFFPQNGLPFTGAVEVI